MKFQNVLRPLGLALLVMLAVKTSYGQTLLFGAKEKGKKFGFINERGDYVIAPAFDEVGFFIKGAAVVKKGKKYGIINEQGQFTVQPIYDAAVLYAPEGKFTVKKGTKWGVVNATGEEIIPFEYEYLSVLKDGYVVAGKFIAGKKYKGRVCPTVLNEKNEVIYSTGQNDPEGHDCTQLFLPGFAYTATGNYSAGWPFVRDGMLVVLESWEGGPSYAQYRVIDVKTGSGPVLPYRIAISDNYLGLREGLLALDRAESNEDQNSEYIPSGIADVTPDTKAGVFFDTAQLKAELFEVPLIDGNSVMGQEFQRVHPYFNNVALVEVENKWVFIDREGWVINKTNLSASEYKAYPPMYYNGLIGFFKNGKAGYVDVTGKVVIPFDLEEYHPFEYAVTMAKKNGLYGLLRRDGTWAVEPKFVEMSQSPCPCYQ